MNAIANEIEADAGHWTAARVMTFAGRGDTRKRTTRDYRTITLGDIFAMSPTDKPKDKAPAFIPSSYNANDGRTHDVQRQRGSFVTLTGDIDEGDHQLDRIEAAVAEMAGDFAHLIYSSPHARPGDMRWRIILPLAEAIPFPEWDDAQNAFYNFMEDRGIKMDRALARAGQPVFLPNVPAKHAKTGTELRDEFGAPLYYATKSTGVEAPGLQLSIGPIADRIAAIVRAREDEDRSRTELNAKAEQRAQKRAEERSNGEGGDTEDGESIIDEFNRNNRIASLLEKYHYARDPANSDDWRSPKQQSQTFATRDMGSAWVSLSGSDTTAGLGSACKTGCFGDAFDLFVHYEHGGNFNAACRELHEERRAAEDAAATDNGTATRPNAKRDWPFRIGKTGVEKRIERQDKDTGEVAIEWKWFCSHLEVAADTRSADGEDWGRLLKITDRDGQVKEWAMPMAMLAGDGTAYRERLLSLGLIIAPGRFAREALHEYISTARPPEKARCVNRIGWAGEAFALSRVTFEGKV